MDELLMGFKYIELWRDDAACDVTLGIGHRHTEVWDEGDEYKAFVVLFFCKRQYSLFIRYETL